MSSIYLFQLAAVVQTLVIKIYPVDKSIGFLIMLICWIVIHPVDSAIQRLNNQGQLEKVYSSVSTFALKMFAKATETFVPIAVPCV